MRRILAGAALAIILAFSATASADVGGARLMFRQRTHTFLLKAAQEKVVRYQKQEGFPLVGLRCDWASVHRVMCEGTWTGVILTGGQPERLMLVDWVTRQGGCATRIVKRTTPDSGIAQGGGGTHRHWCFTGPVVVVAGPAYAIL
jgi:hypothetical protein